MTGFLPDDPAMNDDADLRISHGVGISLRAQQE